MLLRTGGLLSKAVVYGHQLHGALSGWTSATSNHRDVRTAPLRAGAAGLLVALAGATGQVPPVLRRELRYQTFRHYCRLNVALEASAELAYERLVELCDDPVEKAAFERIRADEARHTEAFRVLADALTEDDLWPAPPPPPTCCAASLPSAPGSSRPTSGRPRCRLLGRAGRRPGRVPKGRPRSFGSRRPVVVGQGRHGATRATCSRPAWTGPASGRWLLAPRLSPSGCRYARL